MIIPKEKVRLCSPVFLMYKNGVFLKVETGYIPIKGRETFHVKRRRF